MKRLVCAAFLLTSLSVLAEPLPCVMAPGDLFQPGTEVLAKGLPEGARLAGAGRTLGILVPRLPEGHTVLLVRSGKVVRESWLKAPPNRPFTLVPRFLLADNGNVAVLAVRELFVVYVGSTQVALVEGELAHGANVTATRSELLWGPSPGGPHSITMALLMKQDLEGFKPDEWPPLLVRSDLDGSNPEVLLRLDQARLAASGWLPPMYSELTPVLRSDGKVWLAGPFSGEIAVATTSGRILHSVALPDSLTRPEDDPVIRKEMDEEDQRETERMRDSRLADATRKPPKESKVFSFNKSRLFSSAHARGRDLVLTLATHEPPRGSILVVRDGEEQVQCFQFPQRLRGMGNAARMQPIVTDDAIWFLDPFGFITWESLEALVSPERRPEEGVKKAS